jgi:hypothetical protein
MNRLKLKLPVRNKTNSPQRVLVEYEEKSIRTQIRGKIHQLSSTECYLPPFKGQGIESEGVTKKMIDRLERKTHR